MRREEALAKLRALDLSGFGVKSLELFGSTARDEAKPHSDLDLLVEFEGELTFDRYTSLWDYLEDSLGVKVDLAIRGSLRPYIEPEAIRVA